MNKLILLLTAIMIAGIAGCSTGKGKLEKYYNGLNKYLESDEIKKITDFKITEDMLEDPSAADDIINKARIDFETAVNKKDSTLAIESGFRDRAELQEAINRNFSDEDILKLENEYSANLNKAFTESKNKFLAELKEKLQPEEDNKEINYEQQP